MYTVINTLATPVLACLFLLIILFIWRASVKANQQIRLLEALLDEQKRQNAMLHRLTESVVGKQQVETASDDENMENLIQMIPER